MDAFHLPLSSFFFGLKKIGGIRGVDKFLGMFNFLGNGSKLSDNGWGWVGNEERRGRGWEGVGTVGAFHLPRSSFFFWIKKNWRIACRSFGEKAFEPVLWLGVRLFGAKAIVVADGVACLVRRWCVESMLFQYFEQRGYLWLDFY